MTLRGLGAGLALLLSVMAGATAVSARAGSPAPAFAPPSVPLVLTRTVHRPLPDGEQITVTRRYEIRFSPDGTGYRLDGRLLDARVDAPPRLARLAERELSRTDTALFPVSLDAQGMIRTVANVADHGLAAQQAMPGVQELLDKSGMPPEDREGVARSMDMLAASNRGSAWPVFLFNPGSSERTTVSEIKLRDGTVGRAETRIRAEELTPGGLPRRIERIITTTVAQTERRTREVWTISF